jgi:hypothetical protein
MKLREILLTTALVLFPVLSGAADFLGAPLPEGAEVVRREEHQLEAKSALSHDEALSFYRRALENTPDIKVRDWKDVSYIEDDGRLPWHSITISKNDAAGSTIIISKDSWTWILGTLFLRYIGVFVVLALLWFGISAAGRVMARFFREA